MWKLAAAGIVAALAAIIVRQVKPEFALFVQIGGVAAVVMLTLSTVSDLLAALHSILGYTDVGGGETAGGGSFALLAKALGICVVTQIGADLCRDSGSGALANAVELGGRLLILGLSLPLLKSMAELAIGLMTK